MRTRLRVWLQRKPHPAAMVLDGKRLDISTAGSRWADAEQSVRAMTPTRIELLSSGGALIRAASFADLEDDVDEEEEETTSTKLAKAPTSDLAQLGAILAEACDRSAQRVEVAYGKHFEMMIALVKNYGDRANSLEKLWLRSLQEQGRLTLDLADARAQQTETENSGDGMLSGLLKAVLSKQGINLDGIDMGELRRAVAEAAAAAEKKPTEKKPTAKATNGKA